MTTHPENCNCSECASVRISAEVRGREAARKDLIAIKVTYGYRTSEYVVLDNLDDVARAVYAKIEKIPVTLKGHFIGGGEIKHIVPDIHSYTGWNRSYEPLDGADFAQIERDVPKVIEELIDLTTQRVKALVASDGVDRIGNESLTPDLLLSDKKHGKNTREIQ